MTILLITGSRTWTDYQRMSQAIEQVWLEHRARPNYNGDTLVIRHGGAMGADDMAGNIAREHANLGIVEDIWPADWETNGKAAGFMRNIDMVRAGADICLAFIKDESRGATHCAEQAERAGIPVARIIETTDASAKLIP
jgi:hypothetical protein